MDISQKYKIQRKWGNYHYLYYVKTLFVQLTYEHGLSTVCALGLFG